MLNRFTLNVIFKEKVILTAVIFVSLLFLLSTLVFYPVRSGIRREDDHYENRYIRGTSPSFNRHYTDYGHFSGAMNPGYFFPEKSIIAPHTYKFAAVTDLDKLSRVPESISPTPLYHSLLLSGTLHYKSSVHTYYLYIDEGNPRELYSAHNEAGRGMELSELTLYQNRLLAVDDRTGIIFELLSGYKNGETGVVPRMLITEGDGETDKGMKWEWATVKDDQLYIGSMGKEYTLPDGSVANNHNLWVSIINSSGLVRRVNWSNVYESVKIALLGNNASMGYIIHEAVLWSHHRHQWAFLPRRVSHEAYDEVEDERKGSHYVVWVDEEFRETPQIVNIIMKKPVNPLHGFSSFSFVPGTEDRHALAVRSVEENCVGGKESICKQKSYLIVFDMVTGEVLMNEIWIGDFKYEGIEFVDIDSLPIE